MLPLDTEVRKVPARFVRELGLYLEKDDAWKEFMSTIPKDVSYLDEDTIDLNAVLVDPKYQPKHFLYVLPL
jgi:hypothetical protein